MRFKEITREQWVEQGGTKNPLLLRTGWGYYERPIPAGNEPADKPSSFPFIAKDRAVLRGKDHVAQACSGTFAKRIANALNLYRPTSRGQ